MPELVRQIFFLNLKPEHFWLIDYSLPTFFQIADLANEDTPQLYVSCGRGPRSTLRVLRHGLEVHTLFFSNVIRESPHMYFAGCEIDEFFHVSSLNKY